MTRKIIDVYRYLRTKDRTMRNSLVAGYSFIMIDQCIPVSDECRICAIHLYVLILSCVL